MNRKLIYKVHRSLGITIGFLLFMFGLSGVTIVFRPELMPKVYPSLFHVTPQSRIIPLEKMLKSASEYLGSQRRLTNLYSSDAPDEAYLLLVKDPKKWLPVMVTINQYDGKIVGEMSLVKNVFAVMLFMHSNLFLGKTGASIVGLLGLILLFFILSGIYIWVPVHHLKSKFKKLLHIKRSNLQQKAHHSLGLLFALPLTISAITGFLTIYDLTYQVGQKVVGDPTRIEEKELAGPCLFEDQLRSLSLVTEDMAKNLISLHLCTPKSGLLKVTYGLRSHHYLNGYGRILIHPAKQEIIQEINSDKDPKSWNFKRLFIYPIHSGEYFGIVGRVIVCLGGFGLMGLFISGMWLYLKRSRNRNHDFV